MESAERRIEALHRSSTEEKTSLSGRPTLCANCGLKGTTRHTHHTLVSIGSDGLKTIQNVSCNADNSYQKNVSMMSTMLKFESTTGMYLHLSNVRQGCEISNPIMSPTRKSALS